MMVFERAVHFSVSNLRSNFLAALRNRQETAATDACSKSISVKPLRPNGAANVPRSPLFTGPYAIWRAAVSVVAIGYRLVGRNTEGVTPPLDDDMADPKRENPARALIFLASEVGEKTKSPKSSEYKYSTCNGSHPVIYFCNTAPFGSPRPSIHLHPLLPVTRSAIILTLDPMFRYARRRNWCRRQAAARW